MNQQEPQRQADAWEELGAQFKSLGETIAQALRTSWESEENQRRLNEMRSGLETMVQEVDQAIRETASSPAGQRLREEAERTAQAVQDTGKRTIDEVRPRLVEALQNLNRELEAFTRRMEK